MKKRKKNEKNEKKNEKMKKMRKNEKMKKKGKNEKTWKNEKKWKMKKKKEKWKKWKNEKKTKKMEKNDEKKKEKWRNLASHAKSSTISRVYRCCCNFFRQNPRRFPWFCFGMCLFLKENQQPVLGGNRFSEEKWQFSLDVKQKHTFYRRKSTKKKSLRSAHPTIIILLE